MLFQVKPFVDPCMPCRSLLLVRVLVACFWRHTKTSSAVRKLFVWNGGGSGFGGVLPDTPASSVPQLLDLPEHVVAGFVVNLHPLEASRQDRPPIVVSLVIIRQRTTKELLGVCGPIDREGQSWESQIQVQTVQALVSRTTNLASGDQAWWWKT